MEYWSQKKVKPPEPPLFLVRKNDGLQATGRRDFSVGDELWSNQPTHDFSLSAYGNISTGFGFAGVLASHFCGPQSFIYPNLGSVMKRFSCLAIVGLWFASIACFSLSADAQQKSHGTKGPADQMIANGEFTLALQYAEKQTTSRNQLLRKVAAAQRQSGAESAAFGTLSMQSGSSSQIAEGFRQLVGQGPAANFQQFGQLGGIQGGGFGGGIGGQQQGQGFGNNQNQNGQNGGALQADFTSLISLIENTISPDAWEDEGGTGQSIIEFPNGVLVDPNGLMRFRKNKNVFSKLDLSKDPVLVNRSELRMVSLPKLEQQVIELTSSGKPVPDSVRFLGGMYDIHYVTIDKDSGDLFLVGPAGPWRMNSDGVPVNQKNGKAVLQLDDLVVALRATRNGSGVFGCSIDARPGQYEKFQQKANRLRKRNKRTLQNVAVAVGPSDANVFGVPAKSHAAWAMLAADYHMKLLAMGNLPSTGNVPSYMDLCGQENTSIEKIRWWFTLGQPIITGNQDGTEYKISGPVVRLKTENQVFAGRGGGRASVPATKFVNNFNKHFQEVASQYPLYGQLENLFEMTIAAQILKTHQLDRKVGWNPTFFMGSDSNVSVGNEPGFSYALRSYPVPKEVELVVQVKTLRPRRGQRVGDQIFSVSGGVTATVDSKFVRRQTQKTNNPTLSYKLSGQIKEARKKVDGLPGYVQLRNWSSN